MNSNKITLLFKSQYIHKAIQKMKTKNLQDNKNTSCNSNKYSRNNNKDYKNTEKPEHVSNETFNNG